MEENDVTLDLFQINNQEIFNELVHVLNQDEKWKLTVIKLQSYKNPVYFSDGILKKMAVSSCASFILLSELANRFCTVGHLIEILEECKFLDAVSILTGKGALEIVEQPGENDQLVRVNLGGELKLQCQAKGRPPLSYQWYKFNTPLKGYTTSELLIQNFRDEDVGDYYCIASHYFENQVQEIGSNIIICHLVESCPEFTKQLPQELFVSFGSNIELKVEVSYPLQCKLQWIKGNTILENEVSNVLKIHNMRKKDVADYRCVASNSTGEVYSTVCNLQIKEEIKPRNEAKAKAALLIANEKYYYHNPLKSPCNDVVCLAQILGKLNFHVITLVNLTLVELQNAIQWFFHILPPNAYAFFYYVGHGFQIFNNKFMMPVDCPHSGKFRLADCLCEQLLIQMAMKNKPEFLVIILDMCLKNPDSNENPEIFNEIAPNYKYVRDAKCNFVEAFTTSSHQSAYERPGTCHGIYMGYLSKYLLLDKPLVEILTKAHTEFSKDEVGERQKPSVTFDDRKNCKLTDPVVDDHTLELKMAKVTKIDCDHVLVFPQLNLSANVLVKPHRGHVLNAIDLIFDESLTQWVVTAHVVPDTLKEWHWTVKEGGCSVLTLCNIQKVKSDVCITVYLSQYKHAGFATLELGIPLIAAAKLWFQQRESSL